jgi:hypothetical protein
MPDQDSGFGEHVNLPGVKRGSLTVKCLSSGNPFRQADEFWFNDMSEVTEDRSAAFVMKLDDGRTVYAPMDTDMVRQVRDGLSRWLEGEPIDGEASDVDA